MTPNVAQYSKEDSELFIMFLAAKLALTQYRYYITDLGTHPLATRDTPIRTRFYILMLVPVPVFKLKILGKLGR